MNKDPLPRYLRILEISLILQEAREPLSREQIASELVNRLRTRYKGIEDHKPVLKKLIWKDLIDLAAIDKVACINADESKPSEAHQWIWFGSSSLEEQFGYTGYSDISFVSPIRSVRPTLEFTPEKYGKHYPTLAVLLGIRRIYISVPLDEAPFTIVVGRHTNEYSAEICKKLRSKYGRRSAAVLIQNPILSSGSGGSGHFIIQLLEDGNVGIKDSKSKNGTQVIQVANLEMLSPILATYSNTTMTVEDAKNIQPSIPENVGSSLQRISNSALVSVKGAAIAAILRV